VREKRVLKSNLIHPDILRAIAGAGHGSQILIADGNYPCGTTAGPNSEIVYLNLAPGVLSVTDVLRAISAAVPIEAAHVMQTADGTEPAIFDEFRELLLGRVVLHPVERFAFYAAVGEPSVCLVVATGEQRIYANILLTIGAIPPP
jgi:L-fucose mutarotase